MTSHSSRIERRSAARQHVSAALAECLCPARGAGQQRPGQPVPGASAARH